ncbi:hypothetical protein [Chitinophaga solisilvae]|uniref:hypothetical protein n=1 Tax=Chitinophaga solisilvae TaxID=1233460 RepID=UPI0013694888|nr:hypothetical protein [Chitinophaga solisilvae]
MQQVLPAFPLKSLIMNFELLPVVDAMLAIYVLPAGMDRFQQYLQLLQGNTPGDMLVPAGGFNPMGKKQTAAQLQLLRSLQAERIMAATLDTLNGGPENGPVFKVALNLADDLHGAWTHHFTTDYDNRFKLSGLIARNYATVVFWTSETYSEELIRRRTLESCHRTRYRISHPPSQTLQEHVAQELYVASQVNYHETHCMADFSLLHEFYTAHAADTDYSIIFDFLYGDEAAAGLNYAQYGIEGEKAGLHYIRHLANGQRK